MVSAQIPNKYRPAVDPRAFVRPRAAKPCGRDDDYDSSLPPPPSVQFPSVMPRNVNQSLAELQAFSRGTSRFLEAPRWQPLPQTSSTTEQSSSSPRTGCCCWPKQPDLPRRASLKDPAQRLERVAALVGIPPSKLRQALKQAAAAAAADRRVDTASTVPLQKQTHRPAPPVLWNSACEPAARLVEPAPTFPLSYELKRSPASNAPTGPLDSYTVFCPQQAAAAASSTTAAARSTAAIHYHSTPPPLVPPPVAETPPTRPPFESTPMERLPSQPDYRADRASSLVVGEQQQQFFHRQSTLLSVLDRQQTRSTVALRTPAPPASFGKEILPVGAAPPPSVSPSLPPSSSPSSLPPSSSASFPPALPSSTASPGYSRSNSGREAALLVRPMSPLTSIASSEDLDAALARVAAESLVSPLLRSSSPGQTRDIQMEIERALFRNSTLAAGLSPLTRTKTVETTSSAAVPPTTTTSPPPLEAAS